MPYGFSKMYVYQDPEDLQYDPLRKLVLILCVILALFMLSIAMSGKEKLIASMLESLVTVVVVLISLTVHEWAHAAMAVFLGDPTPARMGRLSLNPLNHLDLFGTIMLFLTNFGWAKPVQVDPSYFRVPARAMMAVAIAGPLANLILAFLSGGLLWVNYNLIAALGLPLIVSKILISFSLSMLLINLSLACFNIIPIPPLDGSKVLAYFMPREYRLSYYVFEEMGPLLLIMFLAFGLVGALLSPMVKFAYTGILALWGLA